MENIEELLRALAGDEGTECDSASPCEPCCESTEDPAEGTGGLTDLLGGLDMEMIFRLMGMLESMNKPSDNERFLLALKPLLTEKNRPKVDSAVKLMKIYALLPLLKDSGLFGKLF